MAVLILRPNANGDHIGFTNQYPTSGSHYDKVDDVTPDDGSTCIYSTGDVYDLFALPNHTTESGTIDYVQVYSRCTTVFPEDVLGVWEKIKTHGSEYEGDLHTVTDSWTDTYYTWTNNPYTGSPWTWTEIDLMQIGIRVSGVASISCTQVYAYIVFTPTATSKSLGYVLG